MESNGEKKRVVTPAEENEEEEKQQDDEEKIDEFFEILGRLREARFATKCLHEVEASAARKKVRVHEPVWTPTFEMEDFAGLEADYPNIKIKFSSNKEREMKEKEGEEKGLDLNLSL